MRVATRGALRAVRRAANRIANRCEPPILVLAYHRVAAPDRDPEALAVRPERFRAQMRHLKARYELLRLDRPWPRPQKPAAIVTFDDGYADNATAALPVLEEEEVPATFFVSTGAVEEGREFWWDELERWLLEGGPPPETMRIEIGSPESSPGEVRPATSFPMRSEGDRESAYNLLHKTLRDLAPIDRESILSQVRAARGGATAARESHRPLTPAEVARLGASEWASVGAHGVTHTPFASLSLEQQTREMVESRVRLEEWTGTPVETFSFPFGGRRDFTNDSVRAARVAGFKRIAANIPGQARRWADPYVVPRFLVRDWDVERFDSELSRFEIA